MARATLFLAVLGLAVVAGPLGTLAALGVPLGLSVAAYGLTL